MEIDAKKARTSLTRLLKRVASGEEVIITKDGKPVARLVPIGFRILGSAKGEFVVSDDFNDPLPKEIEDSFYE